MTIVTSGIYILKTLIETGKNNLKSSFTFNMHFGFLKSINGSILYVDCAPTLANAAWAFSLHNHHINIGMFASE